MIGMTVDDRDQPTAREILDAVLHSQDGMAAAIGRLELELGGVKGDVGTLKGDVATLKGDVSILKSDVTEIKSGLYRLERRVIRIDDRLSVIENLNPGPVLADHERRITRLEGLA